MIRYSTEDNTPPLGKTHANLSTPSDTVLFWFVFRPSLGHEGYVEHHTPCDTAESSIPNSSHHLADTIRPYNTHRHEHEHGGNSFASSKSAERVCGLDPTGTPCSRVADNDHLLLSGINLLALPVLVLPVPRLPLFVLLCLKPRTPVPASIILVLLWPITQHVANSFIFFFSHTSTFQLPDKPWPWVSSLLPPGSCLQLISRKGFSSPTARRFFTANCKLTLSRFPQVNLCTRKSPRQFIRVCTRGDSNSRNCPIPGSRMA